MAQKKFLILKCKYQYQGNEEIQAMTARKPGYYMIHGNKGARRVRLGVGWSVLLNIHRVGREKGLQSMLKCSVFSSTFISLVDYKNDL